MRQEPAQITRAERSCAGIGSRPAPPLAAAPRHGEKAPRAGRQMAVHKAAHVSADQLRCERLEAHDAVDEVRA